MVSEFKTVFKEELSELLPPERKFSSQISLRHGQTLRCRPVLRLSAERRKNYVDTFTFVIRIDKTFKLTIRAPVFFEKCSSQIGGPYQTSEQNYVFQKQSTAAD